MPARRAAEVGAAGGQSLAACSGFGQMFVEVEGHARVYAIADEDLDRENAEKTSSVHFLRFEFSKPMREAVLAGAAVKLGCDHTNYPAHVSIAPETLASLAGDLRA